MSNNPTSTKLLYFSTRDLLIMAVLAALGGVSSTYVNTIGDAAQAALGFPGSTQWAAGLHTVWIVLAMGILNKTGTGTVMGIVKGAVELMSGNTHGIIILLINLVAGLLVDFGFFIFRNKRTLPAFLIAGGLAAGSNVLVFQIFATLPTNILAIGAILLLTLVAAISGVLFSGFAPFYLVKALIKANVVKQPSKTTHNRKFGKYVLMGVLIVTVLLAVFIKTSLQGQAIIKISGAVNNPYEFPDQAAKMEQVTRQMLYRDVQTKYTGYPLLPLIEYAQPDQKANTLLIQASDGYAFLISFDELNSNSNILLVKQGQGNKASYDLVGPESSKAWVRNVVEIAVSASQGLAIQTTSGEAFTFEPDDWLIDMDSTQVALPSGSQKLQGVPLWKIVRAYSADQTPGNISVNTEQESLSYAWETIDGDDHLRIFTVISDEGYAFVLGNMSGEVYLYPLSRIEVD